MTNGRRSSSLRTQLLTRTLLAGLVPLVVLAVVAVFGLVKLNNTADEVATSRHQLAEESATARMSSEATSAGREIGQALDAYIDQLATLASESAVVAAASDGTPAAVSLLIELAETEPAITSLGYTNRTGLIVAATNSVSADSSASGLWDQAWARSVGIGPVSPTEGGATNAGAGLPVAVRIDDVLGVPVGVLTATIDVEFIQAITDFRLEAGVSVTVLSTDGILLAETDSDHSNQRIGIADLDPDALSNGIRQAQETVEGSLVNTDGVYGFVPVVLSPAGQEHEAESGPQIIVVTSQPAQVAFAPIEGLETLRAEVHQSARELVVVVLIVLGFALFVTVAIATKLSRQVIGPMIRLTEQAREVAEHGLPTAVTELLCSDEAVATAKLHRTSIEIEASNEIAELASLFNSVQTTAIELAGEQAQQRRNALQMFANLGRRNQSLVKRQLRFIDELESSEDDPDRLAALFKLDHIATRLRRSAESFLVIAGDRSPVGRSGPVRIELMIQGALAEVEHYQRVDASELEPAALVGRAVGDIAHIVAELVENALSFSPPESIVDVSGHRGSDHYILSVTDRGIGLPLEQLIKTNQRLSSKVDIHLNPSSQLGLIVVAKLAARYGVTVDLKPAVQGGVESIIRIPNDLIQPAETARPESGITSVPEVAATKATQERDSTKPTFTSQEEQPRPPEPPDRPQPPAQPNPPDVEPAQVPAQPNPPDVEPAQVPAQPNLPEVEPAQVPTQPTESPDDLSAEPVLSPTARLDEPAFCNRPELVDDDVIDELSPVSASMVTEVRRRQPGMSSGIARDQTHSDRGSKRSLATTASIDDVSSEAERLRQRWQSFQNGRRRAEPGPDGNTAPASPGQHQST